MNRIGGASGSLISYSPTPNPSRHGPGSRTAAAITSPPAPSTLTSRAGPARNVDHDLGLARCDSGQCQWRADHRRVGALRRVGLGERGVEERGEHVGPNRPGHIGCRAAKPFEQRGREVTAIVGLVGGLPEVGGEGDERLLRERYGSGHVSCGGVPSGTSGVNVRQQSQKRMTSLKSRQRSSHERYGASERFQHSPGSASAISTLRCRVLPPPRVAEVQVEPARHSGGADEVDQFVQGDVDVALDGTCRAHVFGVAPEQEPDVGGRDVTACRIAEPRSNASASLHGPPRSRNPG